MKNDNAINYLLLVVFVAMVGFVLVGAKMADHNSAMQAKMDIIK